MNAIDIIASIGTLAVFGLMYLVLRSNIWETFENDTEETNKETRNS